MSSEDIRKEIFKLTKELNSTSNQRYKAEVLGKIDKLQKELIESNSSDSKKEVKPTPVINEKKEEKKDTEMNNINRGKVNSITPEEVSENKDNKNQQNNKK